MTSTRNMALVYINKTDIELEALRKKKIARIFTIESKRLPSWSEKRELVRLRYNLVQIEVEQRSRKEQLLPW